MTVLLPLPLLPTSATVVPAAMSRSRPSKICASRRAGYENDTPRSAMSPLTLSGRSPAVLWMSMGGTRSTTSKMRRAEARPERLP